MKKEKYIQLWNSYLPAIKISMKNAARTSQVIDLSESDFTSVGDRNRAGYSFRLELVNGKVTNNITGTAVARDLAKVLSTDAVTKAHLKEADYVLKMGRDYRLIITKLCQ